MHAHGHGSRVGSAVRRRRHVNFIEERDPSLIDLPLSLPSVPLINPLVTALIGDSNVKTTPTHAATTPAAQPTPSPPPPPASTPPAPPPPAETQASPPPEPPASSPQSGGGGSSSSEPSSSEPASGGDSPPPASSGDGNSSSSGENTDNGGSGSNGSGSNDASNGSGNTASSGSDGESGSSNGDGNSGGNSSGNSGDSSTPDGSSSDVEPPSASGSGAEGSATLSASGASSTGSASDPAVENAGGSSGTGSGSDSKSGPEGVQGLNVESGSDSSTSPGSHNGGKASATGPASPQLTGVPGSETSTQGSSGSGGSGSIDGSPTGSGPTAPDNSSSASHKGGLSTGVIAAIAAVVGLLLLVVLVCFCRRRYTARRKDRQKTWWFGNKSGFFGTPAANSSYRDSGSPIPPSARSSFATTIDRGQLSSDQPFWNAEMPPVPLIIPEPQPQQMEQVWPSNLSAITVPPTVATVSTSSSSIIRSPNRQQEWETSSLIGSDESHSQVMLFPPPSATSEDSPTLPNSPMLIRPFTPSESWSFPKPPRSVSSSGPITARPKSAATRSSTTTETENPFVDFSDSSEAHMTTDTASFVTADTTAHHFAAVEMVCRPFVPTMQDEIAVASGDRIHIFKAFDDGWAYAENLESKERGLVPVDCLRPTDEPLPAFLASKRLSSYQRTSVFSQESFDAVTIGKTA